MSELIVIATDSPDAAFALRDEIAKMARDYAIETEDVVVITRNGSGQVKLHPLVNTVATQAIGGTVWGLGLGAVFLMPLVGAAIGAATGALTGRFSNAGIDDDFLKAMGRKLTPGRAAVALLARRANPDRLAELVERHEGDVIRAALSDDVAERMPDWVEAEGPTAEHTHLADYRTQPTA